ncbi:MAG: ATP-grasp domain-containing protein [Candidatus Riflebacteria bacterium]|nr:ATP-grasp domain-containing protein [Candidatus Riflebacteria bacterium]
MKLALACNCQNRYSAGKTEPDDTYEEFDSQETLNSIAAAISDFGHSVDILEADRTFPSALAEGKYDFVFNIAEGLKGRCRESLVPAVCEMLEIPYSGSDAITMGVTLDKDLARQVVSSKVPVAKGRVFYSGDKIDLSGMKFPILMKPNAEGSSKGIRLKSKIDSPENAEVEIQNLIRQYNGPVLVEEFIPGKECTVAVLGNENPAVLGIMEIAPKKLAVKDFVYSIEMKRDYKNCVEYFSPSRFSEKVIAAINKYAVDAYKLLGCRDFARMDFRLDADERPVFLEVNPLPGLCPVKSDIVLLAKGYGISYNDLLSRILSNAFKRQNLKH